MRYLQDTPNLGLYLYQTSPTDLIVYSDADWAGCPDTWKSTSGYGIFLGDNLISWSSKCQPVVSQSSAEVEYRAVANGVAEAYWLRPLLSELHCPIGHATIVYCDNISAFYISTNPVQHQRTKHVELTYTSSVNTSPLVKFVSCMFLHLPSTLTSSSKDCRHPFLQSLGPV